MSRGGGRKSVWDVVFSVGGSTDPSLQRTMQQARRSIDQISRAGRQVGQDFRAFAGSLARLGAMATGVIAGAVAGVVGLASNIANKALEIDKVSAALRICSQEWQQFEWAMGRANVDSNKLQYAMRTYQKLITDAASDNGNARQTFENLGLSWEKMSKLSPVDAVLALSDGMKNNMSEAARMNAAYKLFGTNGGPAMVQAMENGNASIIENMKLFEESGAGITEYGIEAARAFDQAKAEFDLMKMGLKNQFGSAFMGPVTEAFGKLSPILQEMQPMFAEWGAKAGQWVSQLVERLPEIIERVKEFGRNTWGRLSDLAEFVGGWENLAKIVGALIIAPTFIKGIKLVYSIGKFLGSLFKELGPIIKGLFAGGGGIAKGGGLAKGLGGILKFLGPKGWIALAVIGLVAIIAKNWDRIVEAVQPAIDRIREAIAPVIEWLTAFWEEHGETVIMWLNKIVDFVGDVLVAIITYAFDKIAIAIETVIDYVGSLWNFFSSAFSAIGDIITAVVRIFQGDFTGALDSLRSAVGNIKDAFSSAFGFIERLVERVVGFISRQFERIVSLAAPIRNMFGGGGGGGLAKGGGIPQHADGGIFYHRHVAEVAERGAEAIVPLKNDPNAYSIWKQAGRLAGFADSRNAAPAGMSTAPKLSAAGGGGAPINVTLSPQFTFNVADGDGAASKIEQAANMMMASFKSEMETYLHNQQRVAY